MITSYHRNRVPSPVSVNGLQVADCAPESLGALKVGVLHGGPCPDSSAPAPLTKVLFCRHVGSSEPHF